MSPRILIENLLNRSPFLSPKSVPTVLVENQEDMLRRDARKSTTDIQKDDDAAHATAELALVNGGYAAAN